MSETTQRQTRQTLRQVARRAAHDAQATLRVERQERDKRLAGLAMDVLVALGERDAAVTKFEQLAGAALGQLLEEERLSIAEVRLWCGPSLTRQEIARLRRCGNDQQRAAENRRREHRAAAAPDSAPSPEPTEM